MPEYTVKAVEKVKEIEGKNGPLVVWKLGLEAADGEKFWAEALKKPGNEPKEGPITGTVEDTQFGKKFKPERTGGFGGGGGGRGHSPEERASIENQVAGKIAADVVCALIEKQPSAMTLTEAEQALTRLTEVAIKAIRA